MNEQKKEKIYLIIGLVFVSSVYIHAFFEVYNAPNVRKEMAFQVFDVYCRDSGKTVILTYGTGKYVFLGNHTAKFKIDHTYHVIYVLTTGSNTPYYDLRILEITEKTP